MVWYNPRSWFGKKENLTEILGENNYKLICDNPECKKEIRDHEVAYNPRHNEFYHVGNCPQLAIVHRTFNTGEMQFMQLEYLSLNDAMKTKFNLESKL